MVGLVEALVHSLTDLSKRKVKRSAHIWSSRLAELYNRRHNLNESQLQTVIRHIVDNNLEGHPKSKDLIKYFLPNVRGLRTLDLRAVAALCYALCTINADAEARSMLCRHVSDGTIVGTDLLSQSTLMRSAAVYASRHSIGSDSSGACDMKESAISPVYECLLRNAMDTVKQLQSNMNCTNVEYSVVGDLLVETLYLLDLLKKDLDFFCGSHRFIDYGSLDGRIRISHLLSSEHRSIILNQISTSSYSDVLSILRRFFYMRLTQHPYVKALFTRLSNTSGAAGHMCRAEACMFLDNCISMLEAHKESRYGVLQDQQRKDLLSYLMGIRNTGILKFGHLSNHRWNHPLLIPRNG